MIKRTIFVLLAGSMLTLLMGACRSSSANLPVPIGTASDAQRTAIAEGRPTLPPTFTPSPSVTLAVTGTSTATEQPSKTSTLTKTLEPSPTPTRKAPPTLTPTWTPDTKIKLPTSVPAAGGSSPTPGELATSPGFGGPTSGSSGCVASPSAPNLLQNPGFEGASYQATYPEIQSPERWVSFWKENVPVTYDPDNTEGYKRPTVQVVQNVAPYNNPPRIIAGNQALMIFGGNKVFDAGVWQQVTVSVNDTICLSGYAQGWSQHQSNDTSGSRLITDDDRRNMNFQLGIDPTGGTEPTALTVVWGQVAHIYDKYASLPTVQVKANASTITVFVRGYNLWRFDHNDMYFDEIKLVKVGP